MAMEISGHKTRQTFDYYHIVSLEDQKAACDEEGGAIKVMLQLCCNEVFWMTLMLYNLLILLVGTTGFEPATPASRTRCSTRLSHVPTFRKYNLSISNRQVYFSLHQFNKVLHDPSRRSPDHLAPVTVGQALVGDPLIDHGSVFGCRIS